MGRGEGKVGRREGDVNRSRLVSSRAQKLSKKRKYTSKKARFSERSTRYSGILEIGRGESRGGTDPLSRRRRRKKIDIGCCRESIPRRFRGGRFRSQEGAYAYTLLCDGRDPFNFDHFRNLEIFEMFFFGKWFP